MDFVSTLLNPLSRGAVFCNGFALVRSGVVGGENSFEFSAAFSTAIGDRGSVSMEEVLPRRLSGSFAVVRRKGGDGGGVLVLEARFRWGGVCRPSTGGGVMDVWVRRREGLEGLGVASSARSPGGSSESVIAISSANMQRPSRFCPSCGLTTL